NFETENWNTNALKYWASKTQSDSRRYPGKKAGSEPETQLVQKWIQEFKPEVIISVHAPYGLIDYDGPIKLQGKFDNFPVKRLGTFPGSLGEYAGTEKKIPVITIELKSHIKMPDPKIIEGMFEYIFKNAF